MNFSKLRNESKVFELVFYVLMTLVYSYTSYQDHYVGLAIDEAGLYETQFGGRFKYLTVIDLRIQTYYFIFSLLNTLIHIETFGIYNKADSNFTSSRIIDYLFKVLVFPTGLVRYFKKYISNNSYI